MTVYDEARAALEKILNEGVGIEVGAHMAKIRVDGMRAIEKICIKRGCVERLHKYPPGAILTVSQNAQDRAQIEIQLSTRLKTF